MATVDRPNVVTRLCHYVGDVPQDEFIRECVDEAATLVEHHAGGTPAPAEILNRATMEVAAELWHRRNAPNGIKQFADGFDGAAAIRVARDPMVAARPLLAPYMPLPF